MNSEEKTQMMKAELAQKLKDSQNWPDHVVQDFDEAISVADASSIGHKLLNEEEQAEAFHAGASNYLAAFHAFAEKNNVKVNVKEETITVTARYVRLPQGSNHLARKNVIDIPKEFLLETYNQERDLWWGSAVYMVLPNGLLRLVDQRWDTSD